jgi:hypothetical protein
MKIHFLVVGTELASDGVCRVAIGKATLKVDNVN